MKHALLLVLLLPAQESKPVADPAQFDCPWPQHSHYKIPWRGWTETRPAEQFLRGIGIVYNVPSNDVLAIRLLAEAGIRAVRREVGWGNLRGDESGFHDNDRLRAQLRLFKKHGMRPTFLLNCHEGGPCPMEAREARLLEDAPKGASTVKLAEAGVVSPGRTGLSGLSGYWAAEALIAAFVPATGEARLSKPLPKDLKAGKVTVATLKYRPLHPVGTPEFDETAAGWVKYARLVGRIAVEEGIDDFDFEIYNELTFGTRFLDIRNYEPSRPKPPGDFLHEGGICWELARRTAEGVKTDFPKARCIWGFSNTTFFHTAADKLPPGIHGQSYHPYGTSTRKMREQEPHKDQPKLNRDGWTPDVVVRVPEGVASTFIQTECVMRLIHPKARGTKPKGVDRFSHYITEHGVLPKECGVTDEPGMWTLKTKGALRSYALWLHKGIDVLHYYSAWYADPGEFGLLPLDLPKLPADARFDDVATPPLRALRNLTRAFAGAGTVASITPLEVEVAPVGATGNVFEGDAQHPPLRNADVFAFLPWQVDATTHAAVVYAATWDAVRTMPEERYRLTFRGTPPTKARLVDPIAGREIPVALSGGAVEVAVTDTPRILLLSR